MRKLEVESWQVAQGVVSQAQLEASAQNVDSRRIVASLPMPSPLSQTFSSPRQFPPRPVCHARHPRTARQSDRLRQSRRRKDSFCAVIWSATGYRMKLTCRCALGGPMVRFRAEPTVRRIQCSETQATDRGAWPTSRGCEQLVTPRCRWRRPCHYPTKSIEKATHSTCSYRAQRHE